MRLPRLSLAAAVVAMIAGPLAAQDAKKDHAAATGSWIVKAKLVVTVEGAPVEKGAVRITGSKIDAIAATPDTTGVPEAHVVDYPDGVIYPGFVDAGSYEGIRRERDDGTRACQPENRIAEAFDPKHPSFARNFAAGVTSVHLVPGNSGVIGGRTSVVKVGEGGAYRVLAPDAGLKVSLVEEAYPEGRAPTSVIGAMSILKDPGEDCAKAFEPLRKGATNVFVSVATSRETLLATGLRRDLGFRTVVLSDLRCARFAADLKDGVAGVILDAVSNARAPYEWRQMADLFASGVPVAFATWSPLKSPSALRLSAVIAARRGIDADRALRAITLDAAKILGVDASIGSLKAGKDADLVVMSGPVTDARSRVLMSVQDGKVVYRAKEGSP